MAFIQCECGAVYDTRCAACPGCGRCPLCGAKRAKREATCLDCDLPYCDCCGRCPGCGSRRHSNVEPCDCGYPVDPEAVARVEKGWPVQRPGAKPWWRFW